MALTKADIFEAVLTELGFPKKQSADIVESLDPIAKSAIANQQ